ncbi:TPA: XVIPCD domain-containing protein [Stenotrophomonas maltophilia]
MSGHDPEQQERVLQARAKSVQAQQHLVEQLQGGGHATEAARLRETYHARELGSLAGDVYASAKGKGEPPVGWTRASAVTDPDTLKAAGISLGAADLKKLMRPNDSGFRAEIYIPDKRVFGDDAKPVLVFKGSTGEIIDPRAKGGRRESGGEDFLNNGRQGVGMQSDYYDRAMALASRLKTSGTHFELAGHSLGGGMASAASAVTGVRATTFNSAGLHPATADRYAKSHGLPVFNTRDTVHTYQTSGEVLNDVQNGLKRLNEHHRQGFGLLASETSQLLRQPGVQQMVTRKLQEMMPAGAQTATAQLVDQLASKSGAEALRNVPVAAGRMELLLDAKTEVNGKVVDRRHREAPSQLAEYGGPLAEVLIAGARGMRAGRVAGEHVEQVGALAGRGMSLSGVAVERASTLQGNAIGTVVDYGGKSMRVGIEGGATVIAKGRELQGLVESVSHRVQAKGSYGWNIGASVLGALGADDMARQMREHGDAARNQHETKAREATREAAADAGRIRAGGHHLGGQLQQGVHGVANGLRNGYAVYGAAFHMGMNWSSHQITGLTSQAPAVLAGTVGLGAMANKGIATHLPTPALPQNLVNLAKTSWVIGRGSATMGESVDRHGMSETMNPSLDAAIASQEAAARKLLGRPHAQLQEGGAKIPVLNDPRHIDFHLFKGAQTGVHGLDVAHGRIPNLQSDQLAGALAAQAKREGLQAISHVLLSDDRTRAFAVDTPDLQAAHRRHAHVDVAAGMAQPLAVSTAQVDALNTGREQATAAGLAQQQGLEAQDNARRMG